MDARRPPRLDAVMRRPSPRLVLALLLTGASACAQDIVALGPDTGRPRAADAALDAGSTDAGRPDLGVDAGLEADAGEPGDAGPSDAETPSDAGADAGLAPLRWSALVLPPNTRGLQAVWPAGPGAVWIGDANGRLHHYDGTWTTDAWRDPSNQGIRAFWGTGDSLFIATEGSIHIRRGGVTGAPIRPPRARSIEAIAGASADEVYVSVTEQVGCVLYRLRGDTLEEVYRPNGVASLEALWVSGPGEVWMAGSQGAIFHLSGGVVDVETIEWPESFDRNTVAAFIFNTIVEHGGRMYAGGNRYLVLRRDPDSVWRPVYTPFATFELVRLASNPARAEELYGVGRAASRGPVIRLLDEIWDFTDEDDRVHLLDMSWLDGDRAIAVGFVRNSVDGVAWLGRR
jgi:hypothetical protein